MKILLRSIFTIAVLAFLFAFSSHTTFATGSVEIPTTGSVTQPFLSTSYPDLSGNYYDTTNTLQNTSTSFHDGVDISAGNTDCTQNQSPVYAAAAGTVISAGYSSNGFGYNVVIDHGNAISSKYLFTLYGHMGTADVGGNPGTSCIVVSQNATVTKGQLLGYQGTSGNSTGVHLHWSVLANPNVDSFSDSNTVWASPDFYTCVPLTVALNTDPSPTANLAAGQNFCWGNVSPTGTTNDAIYSMAASNTSSNVWAAGYEILSGVGKRPVIYRRNGSSWTKYSPSISGGWYDNYWMYGIGVSASGDAWAVGTDVGSGANATLAYHWNGTSWAGVTSDNPDTTHTNNQLNSVGIDGSGSVFAVGQYWKSGVGYQPLIEKWNGTKFATQAAVSLPSGMTHGQLSSVAFSSSTKGWSVGSTDNNTVTHYLIDSYDGTSWSLDTSGSTSPTNLNSVTAVSDNEAWAVGAQGSTGTPLILHYTSANGWQEDTSFNGHYPNGAKLNGVSNDNASDVWISGTWQNTSGVTLPFIMHYDGSNWTQVTAPSVSGYTTLKSVAVNSGVALSGGYNQSSLTGYPSPIVFNTP